MQAGMQAGLSTALLRGRAWGCQVTPVAAGPGEGVLRHWDLSFRLISLLCLSFSISEKCR